ncbi:MAG: D-alanyl-D-alanine carboxypeptidase [Defluviitaleaceae bacterium]|nr:D-alanyl-D-alanine carboxypeptidase [Defluviitaleaceae bacterium]
MKKSITKPAFQIFIALYLVFSNVTTLQATSVEEMPPAMPMTPTISATAAIVMDAQTGFILYEKDIHEARYPASITKIMTALLALEQYANRLYEPILFSYNAVYSIPWDSSHIAMDEGETLSMEDALYGLMLSSANEVANAMAEHLAEDIESFGTLMTRRAAALGAANTTFTNPSGLHDPDQITTAYDMAIITREAIRHPKFLELISTVRHDIPPTERQPQVRELLNSNQLIRPGRHFTETVIGGKTGFTIPAQHTLVTYAIQDDRELIVVTLQGEGAYLYTDTRALLDYAFAIPYVQTPLFHRSQYAQTAPVFSDWSRQRTQIGEVRLVMSDDVYIALPMGFDISEVEYQTYAPSQLVVPIQAGQNIGRMVYSMRGIPMGDIPLQADNTVLPVLAEAEPAPATEPELAAAPITPPLSHTERYTRSRFNLDLEELAENYYLSFLLPLAIFAAGLVVSIGIFKIHRSRKQARLGHYAVIGSQVFRYRR